MVRAAPSAPRTASPMKESTAYTLRRLHSLTGVFPIGVFLLEHFFTNSRSIQGPAAFDQAVKDLGSLPYVTLIEAFGIWLPILFHMVLGIVIAASGDLRLGGPGGAPRFQYVMQRLTGIVLVVFIVFHTWSTRFDPAVMSAPSMYDAMARQLSHPGTFAFYVVGVLSACYHFGNGLFGFAIHWGIATGRTAQRHAARLGFAVFLVLSLVGINALLGFLGRGVNLFERPHAEPGAVTQVEAGR